jgi:hypothetical protein
MLRSSAARPFVKRATASRLGIGTARCVEPSASCRASILRTVGQHPLLDRPLGEEVDDAHRRPLPDPVHASDALFEHGRVPR